MRQGTLHFTRTAMAGTLLGLLASAPVRAQEQLWKSFGNSSGDLFGETVANAGDVNGDGIADLIVGARTDSTSGGVARVVSGFDGSTIHTLYGTTANEQFGFAVAGIGDVNGDGFADFAISSPFFGTKLWVGRVSVFSGQTGALLYRVQRGSFDRLGYSLAPTGDLNGDNVPDFVIGSAYGLYAEVVSGKDGSNVMTLKPSGGVPLFFSFAVATGGDVNGDGVDDIAVGDPDNQDLGFVNGSV